MTFQFDGIANASGATELPSETAMLALQHKDWLDRPIARKDAEALFAAHRKATGAGNEESEYFIEVITRHVLGHSQAKGECSEADISWLMGQIDSGIRLESLAELELLTRIIERAANTPGALKRYALDKIELAVLTDIGPTRKNADAHGPHIGNAECALVRRIIFAHGGDGRPSISHNDTEALLRLKAATQGGPNSAGWETLFVEAMAYYLRQFAGRGERITPELQRDLEQMVSGNRTNIGPLMRRIVRDVPNISRGFSEETLCAIAGPHWLTECGKGAQGKRSTASTAQCESWLDAQIAADGELDALESALLHELRLG